MKLPDPPKSPSPMRVGAAGKLALLCSATALAFGGTPASTVLQGSGPVRAESNLHISQLILTAAPGQGPTLGANYQHVSHASHASHYSHHSSSF